MSPEALATKEQAEKFFDDVWESSPHDGSFIDLPAEYPRHEFLEYLVRNKNILIHGSNWDVDELEPRQANDTSKKFGNQKAVYATVDPIFPLYYAIKDKHRFRGMSVSGARGDANRENLTYTFQVEQKMLDEKPWSDGIVYILPRDSFEQGTDDHGKPIYEFASQQAVKPLAKLRVRPEDFPYLDKIEAHQQS